MDNQCASGHLISSLYPQSRYRCERCGAVHGTQAVNGAVSWQCFACYESSSKQTFIGYACSRCGGLATDEKGAPC